jgi:hypothetical protein
MKASNRLKPYLVFATLIATVSLITTQAHAGGKYPPATNNPLNNNNALGVGVGVGVGTGGAGGNVGNTTLNNVTEASDYGDLRIVPSAIAPSVMNSVICPMVMQGSKAGSVFFFSGSGTHAPDIVPICVAWHLGQAEVVEKMTCAASAEYRKANLNCNQE